MAQPPFDHNAPTHAQVSEQRAKEQKIKDEKQRREDLLRTVGIWIFGLVGCAAIGGIIGVKLSPYQNDASLGLLAGACVFGCARLWLAERRLRISASPAPSPPRAR